MSRDRWVALLDKCWTQHPVVPEDVFPEEIDVEHDWVIFNQVLERLLRAAFQNMMTWTQHPDLVELAARRLKQKGLKGVDVRYKQRFKRRCNQYVGPGCMRMVKLQKRVARLYELQRQLARANQEVDSGPKDASNASVCEALIFQGANGRKRLVPCQCPLKKSWSPRMSSAVLRLNSERTVSDELAPEILWADKICQCLVAWS